MLEVAERARRRIAIRLLPFVMMMYIACYVDRINVAFANLRMSADLGFADRVYSRRPKKHRNWGQAKKTHA